MAVVHRITCTSMSASPHHSTPHTGPKTLLTVPPRPPPALQKAIATPQSYRRREIRVVRHCPTTCIAFLHIHSIIVLVALFQAILDGVDSVLPAQIIDIHARIVKVGAAELVSCVAFGGESAISGGQLGRGSAGEGR